jgi:hypothetical protein
VSIKPAAAHKPDEKGHDGRIMNWPLATRLRSYLQMSPIGDIFHCRRSPTYVNVGERRH